MKNIDACRKVLSEIAALLEEGREDGYCAIVRSALSGPDTSLTQFLVSNTLWGGAESIADSALGNDRTRRGAFVSLMFKLGNLQIDARTTNVRTKTWVSVFQNALENS
jgi:hypothetical protein